MSVFVIAYVPNVENIDHLENVQTVQDVMRVHNINLPFPVFSGREYNYQPGGMLHIAEVTDPSSNIMYQAVYLPESVCDLKGVNLCFTSYNIEDTYDVMIGGRYVIRNSHVKEMSEYRQLELYEKVEAQTPIVIQYYNNSLLEKFLLYDFITTIDHEVLNLTDSYAWNFVWDGIDTILKEQDICKLIISQPNYVNMDSFVETFELQVLDLRGTNLDEVAVINCDSSGDITTTYVESEYTDEGVDILARVDIIAIISVQRLNKAIQVTFKNLADTGTTDPHPIEMRLNGSVMNSMTGGI